MTAYEGGCFCGRVRFRAEGAPVNVRVCHCRMCQRVTGQPFFARALFATEQVAIEGEPQWFASSDDLSRGFCPTCGTTLFSRRGSAGRTSVALAALDDPSALSPTDHFWVESRVAWLKLDDGLPQHPQAAP
ncbi:conserved hypothetical protein [Phenylobacterium zucineum HLK1]|uniref:CENP-V/GFA domain-containing protein n=1 Tax=Phenylobacterium zucineum (strain HLK1) TaxID=450851 RepID=B4RCC4_PHEZH|nr:GFA family protein [Phenylobacterium zucineum]ACG76523.1 conserved hypothetical protein [Phenylobacterium zucineum HLK1]